MKLPYQRAIVKLRFYKSFHYHTALIKWHTINKVAEYIFVYLLCCKVRINLNSKQFFSWTLFYKGSTKIGFFLSLKFKKRWLFSGLVFMWLFLNHVKSLLVVICNSEITILSATQAFGIYRQHSFQCQSRHILRTYQLNL